MTRAEPDAETSPASVEVKAVARKAVLLWGTVVLACAGAIGGTYWQAQQREHDRSESSVLACRNRNSAQEAARADNLAILDGLREPFPSDEVQQLLDVLTSAQSRPEDVDSDCDSDGWLTVDDYAIPKPADLPIELPPIREDLPS